MGVFWISSQPSFPGARLSARCFTFWGLILSKDPVLVAHGGAWGIPDDMVEAHLNGVRNAIAAGWHALSHGSSAADGHSLMRSTSSWVSRSFVRS